MATYTDKELIKIEKRISKIYKQSQAEIQVKWDTYMIKAEKRIEKAKKAYEAAYLAPNADQAKAKELKEQYQKAIYNATLGDKRYKIMVDQVTSKLANVNQEALDYVNDKMPPIYCHAYNEFENQHIAGYSFETVNESAVRNLIKNGDKTLLPKKTVNIPKDKIWNTKNINSQVLQGIIQGESIPKIAKRLQTVTDMNRNASVRNARTMATGAESKGHVDSFKRASKDGVILKKVWVSTHDGRTRDWHADLNGKEANVDEPFDSEYGEISYPGDPTAHPANVYNCRCAVRAKVIGFKWNKGDVEAEDKPISKKATPTVVDAVARLRNSVGDSYEYHRVNNGLNATARDDLGDDFFTVKLTKMDDDVRESFVSQFEHLSSKYDTTVQEIRPMEKMEYLSKKDSFAFVNHDYDFDKSVLVYNPVKINEVSRIKEIVKNGYATQINEELANKYVITHEFAHTLIDMGSDLNPSRNWLGADYKRIKSIRKEIDDVYDKYINEIGALDKAQKAAELDALTTLNEDSWKKSAELAKELKAKSLGKYSLVNSDEFMAECFTHHELGGAQNDYVDMIMDIINRYFRR